MEVYQDPQAILVGPIDRADNAWPGVDIRVRDRLEDGSLAVDGPQAPARSSQTRTQTPQRSDLLSDG